VVSSTTRPYSTPGNDPLPIVQEAGWAPGSVWTGRKSRPTGIRSPDRPARSQSLYRLSYPAHSPWVLSVSKFVTDVLCSYPQLPSIQCCTTNMQRDYNGRRNLNFVQTY
jgi:hypothetical protein